MFCVVLYAETVPRPPGRPTDTLRARPLITGKTIPVTRFCVGPPPEKIPCPELYARARTTADSYFPPPLAAARNTLTPLLPFPFVCLPPFPVL
ncbi:hypothetical protein TNCT_573031 [Trichonephila clavata]|uniref:Uncharacterized protein n=1 Tax=Trichonephila clavata TaxID=2740835 RepID=A0A8X6G2L9_TRICU|nr:hypothetical protein TNCT_573031 [Trichonephila clavata]